MTSKTLIQDFIAKYSLKLRKRVLLVGILIFTGLPCMNLYAQMEEISEKDKEQLGQAEQLQKEAEQLQLTANELYLEAAMLEQNENFATDKKIQKEYKKNQQNAQKTELKAAEKYQEANNIQIEIYQKYIAAFWKNFDGDESVLINARLIEETSKEYFVRASSARDEAKRIDNQTEKFLKLSEAYEYELIGIEKLLTAYKIYKNWPDVTYDDSTDDDIDFQISDTYVEEELSEQKTEPELTTDNIGKEETQPQSKSQSRVVSTTGVELESNQVEKILRYMEEENDTIYFLQDYIGGYDMASIHKFWNTYRNIEYDEIPSQAVASFDDESQETKDEQAEPIASTNQISEAVPEKSPASLEKAEKKTEGDFAKGSETEKEIGRVTESIVPDSNSKIIYRVQIAANRAPLSQAMLQKIYYGKHKIAMVDEGGWYKYSIGEFETFSEANDFKESLNVDDAFVVAYRDAISAQFVEKSSTETTEGAKRVVAIARPKQSKDIMFVVQVAASREPMDESSLNRIYDGEHPVKMRIEENWHKYQIGHTNSYIEIKKVKNAVDVNGAFIVAYREDTKLELWRAIREVHSANDQIIFVLQIAASKTMLSDEKINSIFQGKDHVIEIYEEGWYKYHIICGNTYDAARRFKNLWGIKKSFIVAYKNNKKINIKQAVQQTSN